MTPGRNAPCPCGSGKKYKHCCIDRDRPAYTQHDRLAAQWALQAFLEDPEFVEIIEDALGDFQFTALDELSLELKRQILAEPIFTAVRLSFLGFDLATDDRRSFAQIFLEGDGARLPAGQRTYLERMSAAPMALYEVAAIHPDHVLDLHEVLTSAVISVKNSLGTPDVLPSEGLGARVIAGPTGALEIEPPIYRFSPADVPRIKKDLEDEHNRLDRRRKKEIVARRAGLHRQCSATLLHIHWIGATARALRGPRLVAGAEPLSQRHATRVDTQVESPSLTPSQAPDPEFDELATLLRVRSAWSEPMNLSSIDGLLYAIASGPDAIEPEEWIPEVLGNLDGSLFEKQDERERILALLQRHADDIRRQLETDELDLVFTDAPLADTSSVASLWCMGYLRGVMMREAAWEPLTKNDTLGVLLLPMMALSAAPGEQLRKVVTKGERGDLERELPAVVHAIFQFWRLQPWPETQRPRGRRRKSAGAAADGPAATTVHRLKVALQDVKPRVWRRIEIASDAKLPHVSRALLAAMGWTDSHLHQFIVGKIYYGSPDPYFPRGMRSERNATLAQIAPNAKHRFTYEYDFGDGWRHAVSVEAVTAAEDGVAYPRCTGGARACPPEDCGGPWGYENLLAALADPAHSDHLTMLEWVGGSFEPEAFDIEETNAAIRPLRRKRR